MASRLSYALPIARQLLSSTTRRLRGGLAVTLPAMVEGEAFVIVTGAGRSGTSAVARVLHESGFSMGSNFDEPSEFNEVGFYEETGVRLVNEGMMTELGMAGADRMGRWPWRSTVLAVGAGHGAEMRRLVSEAGGGWKDPYFSVTLEAWLPHLPRRPKLVVCLRSPDAFFDSVSRRFGIVERRAVRTRWARQYRRLLDVIGDYKLDATCVEYDDLVQRPERVVEELSSFVGHELDAGTVEPGLRQFEHPVPREHEQLYRAVLALGGREDAPLNVERDPEEGARGTAPAGPEAIGAYLDTIAVVDDRVDAAHSAWSERAGAPDLRLLRYEEHGQDRSQALAEAHAAATAYDDVLSGAQSALAQIDPPVPFRDYHGAVRASVDTRRLVTQVILRVSDRPRIQQLSLEDVRRAYKRCLSEKALEETAQLRRREYARAVRAGGG